MPRSKLLSLVAVLLIGLTMTGCLTTRTPKPETAATPQNLIDHYCLADAPIWVSKKACMAIPDPDLQRRCMAMREGSIGHNAVYDAITDGGKKCR